MEVRNTSKTNKLNWGGANQQKPPYSNEESPAASPRHPLLDERATRGERTVIAYAQERDGERSYDPETEFDDYAADAITDILHAAEARGREDLALQVIDRAQGNFDAERGEGDDTEQAFRAEWNEEART